jgi:hypothetical protein
MNKKNQGTEVKLSVIAMSAILVASLFVMGSSRFIPDAMAQNFTNQTGAAAGGAANQTGAAGGAANQTGAAAGGAANQTGAAAGGAAGGAANQSAMVMIPQAAMTSMMADIDTVRGAIDEGDTEAVDALDNVEMQLRTAAGLPPAEPEVTDEEEDTGPADEEEDTGPADEEEGGPADEEEDTGPADEDEEEGGTTTPG